MVIGYITYMENKIVIADLERDIRNMKIQIREERLRLKLEQEAERKALWGPGSHTAHPKGSNHYASKSWDVWELDNLQTKEYKYMGRFESIGELARTVCKDYYTIWQMKKRWEKVLAGKLKGKQGMRIKYRIEEAA